jgi:hypothetical protein
MPCAAPTGTAALTTTTAINSSTTVVVMALLLHRLRADDVCEYLSLRRGGKRSRRRNVLLAKLSVTGPSGLICHTAAPRGNIAHETRKKRT